MSGGFGAPTEFGGLGDPHGRGCADMGAMGRFDGCDRDGNADMTGDPDDDVRAAAGVMLNRIRAYLAASVLATGTHDMEPMRRLCALIESGAGAGPLSEALSGLIDSRTDESSILECDFAPAANPCGAMAIRDIIGPTADDLAVVTPDGAVHESDPDAVAGAHATSYAAGDAPIAGIGRLCYPRSALVDAAVDSHVSLHFTPDLELRRVEDARIAATTGRSALAPGRWDVGSARETPHGPFDPLGMIRFLS